MTSRADQPQIDPGEAVAEEGVVMLDGPNGVAVSMTPDCARGTADNLYRAADEAVRQRETTPD